MTESKTRDQSVDFAKGIAMIAVSFGHTMPVLYGQVDAISKVCYSFELATFFIVSGYLQFGRTDRTPADFIRHHAESLLYPYITFSLALFSVEGMLSILKNGFLVYLGRLPEKIALAVTWGEGAAWFFPTFFLSGVLAYLCRKERNIPRGIIIAGSIIVGSVLCSTAEKYGYLKDATMESIVSPAFWMWHLLSFLARSIVGASLMLTGMELKRLISDSIGKCGGGYFPMVGLLVAGVTAALANYDMVDFHFAFIRNPILFYISALCFTEALLLLGRKFHPKCIVWCGRESLLLILAQTGMAYICYAVEAIWDMGEKPYAIVLVTVLAVLIGSLAVSYLAIKLIHSTFLEFMVIPPGKKDTK